MESRADFDDVLERLRKEFPGTSLLRPEYRLAPLTTISFDAIEDEIAWGGETWQLFVPRTDANGEPYEEDFGEVLVLDSWPGGPKVVRLIAGQR